MRYTAALLLLLFLISCDSSPSVGFGVLHFEDTSSQRLRFYNQPDTLAKEVFYVDITFEDSLKNVRSSLNYQTDTLAFYPLYQGTASVSLQVLVQKGNWYKVYTDENTDVAHWVYAEGKRAESWRSFWPTVKTVFSDDKTNPLRENPSVNAKAYPLRSQRLCLKVLEVHGDWLKVQNAPDRCPDSYVIQEEFEGFICWKNEGQVLVNFKM